MRSWGSEEGKKGGRRQSFPGKGQRLIFLERVVKCGVEAGHPERRQGLKLVVWVQPHICFVCIPGNGSQVARSTLLPLELRPYQESLGVSLQPGKILRSLSPHLIAL